MEFGENGAVIDPNKPESKDLSASPTSTHGYSDGPRTALGLFRAMRTGLIAFIVLSVVWLCVLAGYLVFPAALPDFMFTNVGTGFSFYLAFSIALGVTTVAAFFLSCRFTYRTMRNLHTVQSPVAKISPGWAVGYYFIPFVNFAMPANAMSQIYHGTHAAVGDESRHASPIPLWWSCWLLRGVAESIADRSGLLGLPLYSLYAASLLLGIAAAVALIRMGGRVADRQERLLNGGIAQVFD